MNITDRNVTRAILFAFRNRFSMLVLVCLFSSLLTAQTAFAAPAATGDVAVNSFIAADSPKSSNKSSKTNRKVKRKTPRSQAKTLPACLEVESVCRAAGYGNHGVKARKGTGLQSDCVRPLARGVSVAGVSGVSKQSAAACMKAHRNQHK